MLCNATTYNYYFIRSRCLWIWHWISMLTPISVQFSYFSVLFLTIYMRYINHTESTCGFAKKLIMQGVNNCTLSCLQHETILTCPSIQNLVIYMEFSETYRIFLENNLADRFPVFAVSMQNPISSNKEGWQMSIRSLPCGYLTPVFSRVTFE